MSQWKLRVRITGVLLVCLALGIAAQARADVKLPKLFQSNMVLAHGMRVPVWGTADPGEAVTVSVAGQTLNAVADAKGEWRVHLAPMKPGGPVEMSVTGKNTLKLTNVLIGEVWVCSGQSNMAWPTSRAVNGAAEVAAADYPQIRLFQAPRRVAEEPQKDLAWGAWQVCGPKTVGKFSAVGYFFGRELHRELNVPVGLIQSDWGGTACEAWTDLPSIERDPAFKDILDRWAWRLKSYPDALKRYEEAMEKWRKAAEEAKVEGKQAPRKPRRPAGALSASRPAGLYNAMIAPLIPYGIRGVIWYQGEANASRAAQYRKLLPAMIAGWRANWEQGDFPFLIVQLANFMRTSPQPRRSAWAELRDAQLLTARNTPNCALAVAIDVGEAGDIHPKNKQDVGKRLALAALGTVYGKDIVTSGPVCTGAEVEGPKVRLKFKHTGGGLIAKGGDALVGFAVAGEDRKFVWADAKIEGDTVLVWSDKVAKPVAVRYAWADNPICNLYNAEGLPASPFRTDDWEH